MHKTLDLVRILTFFALSILFLTLKVNGDLVPHEDTNEESEINNIKADIRDEKHESTTQTPKTNLGFIHAFIASFSVIIVSEIGDKTFFIAAIMSMVRTIKKFINIYN